MCGYACCGCGRCGKPRTMPYPPIRCSKCKSYNDPFDTVCANCGTPFPKAGESAKAVLGES